MNINPKLKSSLSTMYQSLVGDRSSFKERGESYSRKTLPYILPSTISSGAQNMHGYQGIGAEAVNHLSNKIVSTLFPVVEPFFSLKFDDEAEEKIEASGADRSELDVGLNKIVDMAIIQMNNLKLRPSLVTKIKHLIITGNACLVFTDRGVKLLGLNKYVVKRDPQGNLLKLITHEKVSYLSLPADLKLLVRVQKVTKDKDENEVLDLYTGYCLQEDETFTITQAVGEYEAIKPITGIKPDNLPAVVGRWNATSGEDYGRGLVEDHSGDFHVLEFLSEARAKGAATMMDVKYLVRPGSLTDVDTLNKAGTGEFVQGMEDDISVLQLDKYADGRLIQDVMSEYQERIQRAFLMVNAAVRDSERTTAFEIQKVANELDLSLGGIYSTLSVEVQKPVAVNLLAKVDQKLVGGKFNPSIQTGIEALGRSRELEKIAQYSEMMALPASWAEPIQKRIDWTKYSNMISSNIALDTSFLIPEEEVQKSDESEQGAGTEGALAESLAKSAGNSLGKQMIEGKK
jgi:hypothetical protein